MPAIYVKPGVTTVSVVSANGFAGTVANPGSTPAITLTTPLTGLLKGNATAILAATAGTDFLAPAGSGAALTGLTSSQIGSTPAGVLKGAAGAIAAAVAGTDYVTPTGSGSGLTALNASNLTTGTVATARMGTGTASAGTFLRGDSTWQPVSGAGTVTTISVASSNGFAGTVANPTSTPVITLSSPVVTPVLKSDGTSLLAAVAGTDFISGAAGSVTLPQMANLAATSLIGNATGAAAVPTAINLAASTAPNMRFVGSSLRSRVPLFWIIAPCNAVVNTVGLQSVLVGGTIGGTRTIPANTIQPGMMLRFELFGTFGDSGGTLTIGSQIALNATIVAGATSPNITNTNTNIMWMFDHFFGSGFMFQAIGISGKIIGCDRVSLLNATSIPFSSGQTPNNAPTQVTINTTIDQTVDINFQWSVASAANSIQITGGVVYLDG